MQNNLIDLFGVVAAFFILIALFLIFRAIVLWYWKINESLEVLKDIRDLILELKINKRTDEDKQPNQSHLVKSEVTQIKRPPTIKQEEFLSISKGDILVCANNEEYICTSVDKITNEVKSDKQKSTYMCWKNAGTGYDVWFDIVKVHKNLN